MRNARPCLVYALPVLTFLVANVHVLAQDREYRAEFKQEKLERVLEYFSQNYNILFAYNPSAVSDIYVSCDFNNHSLTEAMDEILSPIGFKYKIQQENRILLIPDRGVLTSISDRAPPPVFQIMGTIRDSKHGIPLAYANIRILGTKKGTITDQNGQFVITGPADDTVKILCSYLGYRAKEISVSANGSDQKLRISLEPSSTEIDEVLITDGFQQTVKVSDGAGTIHINPKESHLISGFGEADILRTIQLLPGINSTENQGGLHIRGSTPDQNLVLIDGITAYGIDHYFGMFSAVNNQAIENVNINRGGFGAKYGGRLSGIIDVSGKRATADSLKLYTHLSLLNSNVSIEMPLYQDKVTLLLAGRKSFPLAQKNPLYSALTSNFSNSSQSLISQNDPVRQYTTIIPEFDFSDANVKLSIRPGVNDLVEASFFTSTDNLNYFVQDREDSPVVDRLTSDEVVKVENLGYSFSWSHQWSEKFYSKQNVAYSTYSNQYGSSFLLEGDSSVFNGNQSLLNTVNDLTVRSDYMLNLNRHNKLSFGLHYKELSSLNREEYLSDDSNFFNELDNSGQSLAGYAQYDLELSEKFSISSGLRVVNYKPFKNNFFEPRLSATYRFSPKFSSKVAWGRYNQFIRQFDIVNGLGLADDYWAVSSDATLPVSSAEHFILGAAFESTGFLIDVEVYQKNLYELSTIKFNSSTFEVGVSGDREFLNGGSGKSRGVDLMIQRKSRRYEGWLSYSYNSVMHTFEELNDGNPFPAAHENRHQVKLVNSIHLGKWSFGGTLIFATGNPYTDAIGPVRSLDENGLVNFYLEPAQINGRRLPNYHRLDGSAVYNFPIGQNGNGKIGLSLYNVYNRLNIRDKRIQLFNQVDRNGNVTPIRIESDILHQPFIPNFFIQASF